MPDSYTPNLRLTQPEVGQNADTWGGLLNAGAIELLDQAIAGVSQINLAGGDITLTAVNGSTDQSRPAVLEFLGTVGPTTVTVPAVNKLYFVRNTVATHVVTLTTGSGTTVALQGETAVWLHVAQSGNVSPASVPVDISAGGVGGIKVAGAFSTPSFSDLGDLQSLLIRLGATGGVELNPGNTDLPLTLKSQQGITMFEADTKDAGASETASVSLGGAAVSTKVKGDLALEGSVPLIKLADQTKSLLLLASGGAAETGSALALIGDQEATTPAARGFIDFTATTAAGLEPKVRFVGFNGGVEIDGNQVWHAGNDGEDSGLDADMLRTIPGDEFLHLEKTSVQVAKGIIQGEFTSDQFIASAQTPEIRLRRVDGGGVQQSTMRLAIDTDNDFTILKGSSRAAALVLRNDNNRLYRGPLTDDDEFISTKGDYLQTDGGASGFIKLGTLHIQYGENVAVSPGTFASVVFPTPFPTACRAVSIGVLNTSGIQLDNEMQYSILSNTTMRIWNFSSTTRVVSWMAMGD